MNGRSPDEVFKANLIEQRMLPKDKADYMFMRYAKSNTGTLKVGKNGISLKFYGQELQYWNEELWRLYFGKEVYVRYAPDDLSLIRVYDTDKRFICTAEIRTAVGYRADKEVIKELTREKRSAVVKRVEITCRMLRTFIGVTPFIKCWVAYSYNRPL